MNTALQLHATIRPMPEEPHSHTMPYRILAILDGHHADHFAAMLGTLLATTASFWVMLADSVPTPESQEMRLLLMPLIGSLVATTGAYLLSPKKEEPRKLAGRSIYSVAIGTALPVTFGFVSDYGRQMASHPVALFLAGILGTTVVFILIRPIIDKLFTQSGALADIAIDAAANAAHLPKHYKADKPDTDPPTQ